MASGHSDVRFAKEPARPDDTTKTDPQRTRTTSSMERPPKRRSHDASYHPFGFPVHLDTGDFENDFLRASDRHSANSSSDISNSLSVGQLDHGLFDLDTDLTSNSHDASSGNEFNAGTGISLPSSSHPGNDLALTIGAHLAGRGSLRPGNAAPTQASSTPLPPMTSPEHCLHYLSELCSGLLRNVSDDGNVKALVDVLSYKAPPTRSSSSSLPKNAIGRVLESSQLFFDILDALHHLINPERLEATSPMTSECSYSDLCEPNEFIHSVTSSNPGALLGHATEGLLLHAEMDPSRHELFSGDHQLHAAGVIPAATTPSLDMPTTLTILTCYTWLLRTYDTIFTPIHASLCLEAPTMPSIFPGLSIGGFDLCERTDLQIEMLMQLSTHMLERIERMLGISVISTPPSEEDAGEGLLDSASSSAILDVLFRPNNGQRLPSSRVKQTMSDIRAALRRGRA